MDIEDRRGKGDIRAALVKYADWLLPAVCLGALFLYVGLRFAFYFDLNDDVLIKDILSGVYTGEPEALTAQLLWPLGWLLSVLYRLAPAVPVYGLFLWLCQAGSLFVIMKRSMRLAVSLPGKAFLCVTETLTAASCLLYHLVFVQYTVAGGLLLGAAAVWLLTDEKRGNFLRRNLPAALLALLSFCLRSEMMLLLLPLAAVGALWKWLQEERFWTRENAVSYLGLLGLILGGMALALLSDRAAYGAEEWKEFRALFDARTQIYDFNSAGVRSYGENQAFYDSLGMTKEQCALLENYNFGADDRIDAALLEQVAAYGQEKEGYFVHSLPEGLWLYRERLKNNQALGFQEMPFLLLEAALAVLLILTALCARDGRGRPDGRRQRRILGMLVLSVCVRSGLWMYLILRERVPERISHPLYVMELLILGMCLLTELGWERGEAAAKEGSSLSRRRIVEKGDFAAGEGRSGAESAAPGGTLAKSAAGGRLFSVKAAAGALLLAAVLSGLPGEIDRTEREYGKRQEIDALDRAARTFYGNHPQNLYLADVMSTVEFSQKLFDTQRRLGNYDLLGGWLCKSPHARKKLGRFGYASLEEALLNGENVYLAAEPGADWDWLEALFQEKGHPVQARQTDTLRAGEGSLIIWRLDRLEER